MSALDKKRLIPEDKGRVVIAFLESFFARYVEYDFTADLEEQLDRISTGELDWKECCATSGATSSARVDDIKDLRVTRGAGRAQRAARAAHLPAARGRRRSAPCPTCGTGQLSLKLGKFGAFIGCSNYPECRYTRQLAPANGEASADGGTVLGEDPETGLRRDAAGRPLRPLRPARRSRGSGEKPKRAGIPKGSSPDDIDLEHALELLSLPREIGNHPETGEPILAGIGRFGPFVQHEQDLRQSRSWRRGVQRRPQPRGDADRREEVATARAAAAWRRARKRARRASRHAAAGRGQDRPLRPLCQPRRGQRHPAARQTPETVTLEEAVALIDERAAKGGGKTQARRKKAAPRKAAQEGQGEGDEAPKPAKKAAAKKAAASRRPDAASKARAPVAPAAKTSAAKACAAAKAPAKKSAGKARG